MVTPRPPVMDPSPQVSRGPKFPKIIRQNSLICVWSGVCRFLVVGVKIFRRKSWVCIVIRGFTARVCTFNVRLSSTESSCERENYFLFPKIWTNLLTSDYFFELFLSRFTLRTGCNIFLKQQFFIFLVSKQIFCANSKHIN